MTRTAIGKRRDIKGTHPCFSKEAHHRFGRIHLPVAPVCNIKCRYCVRKYDCANESRPGITSRVMKPHEALERVEAVLSRNDNLTVVGIAGPGDPLANDATFETLALIHRALPQLTLCLSTNGLALPDRIEDLMCVGVRSITITINALTLFVAEKIYSWINYRGMWLEGKDAAERLVINQQRGLINAIDAGFMVKVNTVCIPGINDAEIPMIAWYAGLKGADIMNIIPLIPQASFSHLKRPSAETINRYRAESAGYIEQMTHCRQCRADACGVLGEDKDMELELLHARIGEDYCEMV